MFLFMQDWNVHLCLLYQIQKQNWVKLRIRKRICSCLMRTTQSCQGSVYVVSLKKLRPDIWRIRSRFPHVEWRRMHPQLVGCTMQQLLSICEDHDGGRQVASVNTKRAYFEKRHPFLLQAWLLPLVSWWIPFPSLWAKKTSKTSKSCWTIPLSSGSLAWFSSLLQILVD